MIDPSALESCVYCPKLCRDVCPVAVGSAREAATPTAMMTAPWSVAHGFLSPKEGLRAAALCTSCGACTTACKLDRPVAELLREARAEFGPAQAPAPVGEIEGEGAEVAIEAPGEPWAQLLATALGRSIARLRTPDDLGADLIDQEEVRQPHLDALRARMGTRVAIVQTHGAARVCQEAGVAVRWLADLVPIPQGRAPLAGCGDGLDQEESALPTPGCCGGAGPLLQHHPTVAEELRQEFASRAQGQALWMRDGACAARLRDAGVDVLDALAALRAAALPTP